MATQFPRDLLIEPYTFDPRPTYRLKVAAKRYSFGRSPAKTKSNDAVTLVVFHGTYTYKEYWEPAISDLLSIEGASEYVEEIWAFDAPYHGDTALLNEADPAAEDSPYSPFDDCAHCIQSVLSLAYFQDKKLVGVGHSMGAACVALSTILPVSNPLHSLILIEPICQAPSPSSEPSKYSEMLMNGAKTKQEVVRSKEAAYEVLRKRWKYADDRYVRGFAEYAFRPLPSPKYPDEKEGFALKCTIERENAMYADSATLSKMYTVYPQIATLVPTHVVLAETLYMFPQQVMESGVLQLGGPNLDNLRSLQYIPNSDHTVVQDNPPALAKAVLNVLKGNAGIDKRMLSAPAPPPVPAAEWEREKKRRKGKL